MDGLENMAEIGLARDISNLGEIIFCSRLGGGGMYSSKLRARRSLHFIIHSHPQVSVNAVEYRVLSRNTYIRRTVCYTIKVDR